MSLRYEPASATYTLQHWLSTIYPPHYPLQSAPCWTTAIRSRVCRTPQCFKLIRLVSEPYTLHHTPYTLHPTHYTLHTTHFTLHPTHYTLHPKPDTRHPTPYTLHTPPYALHTTHYTRHTPPRSTNTGLVAAPGKKTVAALQTPKP